MFDLYHGYRLYYGHHHYREHHHYRCKMVNIYILKALMRALAELRQELLVSAEQVLINQTISAEQVP